MASIRCWCVCATLVCAAVPARAQGPVFTSDRSAPVFTNLLDTGMDNGERANRMAVDRLRNLLYAVRGADIYVFDGRSNENIGWIAGTEYGHAVDRLVLDERRNLLIFFTKSPPSPVLYVADGATRQVLRRYDLASNPYLTGLGFSPRTGMVYMYGEGVLQVFDPGADTPPTVLPIQDGQGVRGDN
jgi:hypothetical protein